MQPVVQLELFRNSKTDQKLPSRYRHRLPVFSWAAPYEGNLTINAEPTLPTYLPVVSIVVPFFGLPFPEAPKVLQTRHFPRRPGWRTTGVVIPIQRMSLQYIHAIICHTCNRMLIFASALEVITFQERAFKRLSVTNLSDCFRRGHK